MLFFALNLQPTVWRFADSILQITKARLVVQCKKLSTQSTKNILPGRHANSIPAIKSTSINSEQRLWTDAETSQLAEYVESNFVSKGHKIHWKVVGNQLGIPPYKCKSKYNNWKRDKAKDKIDPFKVVRTKTRQLIKRRTSTLNKANSLRRMWTPGEISRLRTARGDPDKRCESWEKVAKYVGNRRTSAQCINMWRKLLTREKLIALQGSDTDSAACYNRAKPGKYAARIPNNWTRDETDQLDALYKEMLRQDPKFLLIAACKLYPQTPRIQVQRKLESIKASATHKIKKAHVLRKLPELQQMVKDYGGVEKADWKAISKVAGLTEHECLNAFRWAFVPTRKKSYWTRDDEDRLVQSLRSQRQSGDGSYNWDKAAMDVGKFTSEQCRYKFYRSAKARRAVEQPLSDTLSSLSEE